MAQAVFILLLQKRPTLRDDAALGAWLFSTTRYAAKNALRAARRRHHHEGQAAMNTPLPNDSQLDFELLSLLDTAIADLPTVERKCVILVRLEGRPYEEAGQAMGMTPEAVRKRVSRAMERLRQSFQAAGHAVAPSAMAGLFVPLPLPPHLVASTSNVAQLSATSPAYTIAQGVRKMVLARKLVLTTTAMLTLATMVIAGGTLSQPDQPDMVAKTLPATAGHIDPGSVIFARVVGIATVADPKKVWGLDGKPVAAGALPTAVNPMSAFPRPTHRIYLKVEGEAVGNPEVNAFGVNTVSISHSKAADGKPLIEVAISPAPQKGPTSLVLSLPSAEWLDLLPGVKFRPNWSYGGTERSALVSSFYESGEGTEVFVATEPVQGEWTAAATLADGTLAWAENLGSTGAGSMVGQTFRFPVEKTAIKHFQLKYRPYERVLKIENITLDPAKPLIPVITLQRTNMSP